MEILLSIIIGVLIAGFLTVSRILFNILAKMQSVKAAADLARAETLRTMNNLRKRG